MGLVAMFRASLSSVVETHAEWTKGLVMSASLAIKRVVLIVEDEPLLLFHARDLIEEAGYEVLVAANADDAVILLEQRLDIAIVFTDVHMPGSMDGVRLADAIRRRWPPIALVLTSGRASLLASDMPLCSVFLSKPYAERDLQQALQSAAGSPAPSL